MAKRSALSPVSGSLCILSNVLLIALALVGNGAGEEANILRVSALGEATIARESGQDWKAGAAGMLRARVGHALTDRIFASAALLAAWASPARGVEHAWLRLDFARHAVTIGALHLHLGAQRYLRQVAIDRSFDTKGYLLDRRAIGVAAQTSEPWNAGVAVALDSRESGLAALWGGGVFGDVDLTGVVQFCAYDNQFQDNGLHAGVGANVAGRTVGVHCAIRFSRWFGYGGSSNPTMSSGLSIGVMAEGAGRWRRDRIGLYWLTSYESVQKRYRHESLFAGGGLEVLLLGQSGPTAVAELANSDGIQTIRTGAGLIWQSGCNRFRIRTLGIRSVTATAQADWRAKTDMEMKW